MGSQWSDMPRYQHPARVLSYREIVDGLAGAVAAGTVSERRNGDYSLFCYTQRATYERAWDQFTMMARGLILDRKRERIAATPFEKFFNLGERDQLIPDLGFDVLEKLDGSLIIIWHDGESWRCCTKGSFDSDQAKAARLWLGSNTAELHSRNTYLAEWVAPDNRIVVSYEKPELVLLSVFGDEGNEWSYALLQHFAERIGWRVAERHDFASIADLVIHAGSLPATREGFVLRFADGLRLKIKGDEYRRIHALISRCTPLAMWEAMQAGDDLSLIRQQLPEEFWTDFDAITTTLDGEVRTLIAAVAREAAAVADWPDKEVGLRLAQWPEPVRQFIFPYRKNGGDLLSGKTRQSLFRTIRPTGNVLEGYTPSYAINRVTEESNS